MVPDTITHEHVVKAAEDFRTGVKHRFADSVRYDVVIDGVRYPPKAIVGLAARHATGKMLTPEDFSGGVGSSCFRLLRRLGFDIVLKADADHRSAALVIGETYSRSDLYAVLGVPREKQGGDWDTGYHRHGDEYFIFCGIGTPGRTGHDYGNHFDGDELVWFGKPGSKYHHPSIQAMVSGEMPVHVLFRSSDRDPFEYGGPAEAIEVDRNSSPVKVRWRFEVGGPYSSRLADEVDEREVFIEGAKQRITVNAYERNPVARRRCIEHFGTACVACGFEFDKAYGERGKGFIHVHHLRPLARRGEEYELDPIADLRPVCPNCHAMIHAGQEVMSLDDLRSLLSALRGGSK